MATSGLALLRMAFKISSDAPAALSLSTWSGDERKITAAIQNRFLAPVQRDGILTRELEQLLKSQGRRR